MKKTFYVTFHLRGLNPLSKPRAKMRPRNWSRKWKPKN